MFIILGHFELFVQNLSSLRNPLILAAENFWASPAELEAKQREVVGAFSKFCTSKPWRTHRVQRPTEGI